MLSTLTVVLGVTFLFADTSSALSCPLSMEPHPDRARGWPSYGVVVEFTPSAESFVMSGLFNVGVTIRADLGISKLVHSKLFGISSEFRRNS